MQTIPTVLLAASLAACAVDSDVTLPREVPPLADMIVGRWQGPAPCEGCLAVHDIAAADGGFRDEIAVTRRDGTTCTMTRAYRSHSVDGGAWLVDYAFLADGCRLGPIGIVFEEFAIWDARDEATLEVFENLGPAAAPVAIWQRI